MIQVHSDDNSYVDKNDQYKVRVPEQGLERQTCAN